MGQACLHHRALNVPQIHGVSHTHRLVCYKRDSSNYIFEGFLRGKRDCNTADAEPAPCQGSQAFALASVCSSLQAQTRAGPRSIANAFWISLAASKAEQASGDFS